MAVLYVRPLHSVCSTLKRMYFTELTSWSKEVNTRSASQNIPCLLWNGDIRYSVHKDLTVAFKSAESDQHGRTKPFSLKLILILSTNVALFFRVRIFTIKIS